MSFNLDDALIFFNIIESKPIHWGIDHFDKGRFYPLAFMDLNLLMRLFPTQDLITAPRIYFLANVVAFTLLASTLYYLLLQTSSILISAITMLVCFVNVGFVIVFMGVCFPEKLQAVWLSGFIWSLFWLIVKQKHLIPSSLMCILCGGVSMFYKEPDFILICGSLAVCLAYSYSDRKTNPRIYTYLLIISSIMLLVACLFIGLYLYLVLPNIQKSYANFGITNLQVAKDMANSLLYHPFLCIFAPAVLALRLYKVFQAIKHKQPLQINYALYDALLIASLGYAASFFILMIFTPYYFFPCYIMALLPIAFYAKRYYKHLRKLLAFTFVLHTLINIPSALSTYTSIKLLPPHYLQATQFLADYTRTHPKTTIFMLGQGQDSLGKVFYGYLEWFVRYFGGKDFDLATNIPPSSPQIIDTHSPYTISTPPPYTPQSGDLIYGFLCASLHNTTIPSRTSRYPRSPILF